MWLLVHGNTQYAHSMYRFSAWRLYNVHVTGISTRGFHTKCMVCMLRLVHEDYRTWELYTNCTSCMLQVWVNCDHIICTIACYGIGTIIFLIVIVNMEYDIIVFIARDSMFQIWIVSAAFGSSCFCWVTWFVS